MSVTYLAKVVLRLAGRGSLADLEHVGRTSGTVRHTPLSAFRTNDSVIVGITFGQEPDWLKNTQVADRCRMTLRGEVLELGIPEAHPLRERIRGMPWWFRLVLRSAQVFPRTCSPERLPCSQARP